MNQINGAIHYQSKDGKLTASEIQGSGSFNVSGEGDIDISFVDVISDISAYSKNGRLTITLPSGLNFKFSAITKKGFINTSFANQLTITNNAAIGTIGTSPNISVEAVR